MVVLVEIIMWVLPVFFRTHWLETTGYYVSLLDYLYIFGRGFVGSDRQTYTKAN